MHYYYKPSGSEKWLPLETDSIATELSRGSLKWGWQIKRSDGTNMMTVGEMINSKTEGITDTGHGEAESNHPPTNALCYLLYGEQQTGPYTPDQIRSMWTSGQITADTLYWFEGSPQWVPVREFVQSALPSSIRPSEVVAGSTIAGSYFLAVLIPIIGFFAGLYLILKKQAGHGVACMALSVIMFIIVFSLLHR